LDSKVGRCREFLQHTAENYLSRRPIKELKSVRTGTPEAEQRKLALPKSRRCVRLCSKNLSKS